MSVYAVSRFSYTVYADKTCDYTAILPTCFDNRGKARRWVEEHAYAAEGDRDGAVIENAIFEWRPNIHKILDYEDDEQYVFHRYPSSDEDRPRARMIVIYMIYRLELRS